MYKNLNFDRTRSVDTCHLTSISRVALDESLKDKCLNDNTVVRIIFKLVDKLGIVPNTLDYQLNNRNYPAEIQQVIDMLNKEYPAIQGFKTDREAFDTIKSRYIQEPGEIQQLVDKLAADFITSKSSEEGAVEDVRATNDKATEYGTDV